MTDIIKPLDAGPDIFDALQALVPGAKYECRENMTYGNIVWHDDRPMPTESELHTKVSEMVQEHIQKKYSRDRQTEYPNIGEQLGMLWDAMDSGEIPKATKFYNAIKSVKDKYPKS